MNQHRPGTTEETGVVVVHRGSRDAYQLAAGLAQAGMLDALFTDLYWPASSAWARPVERLVGAQNTSLLRARSHADLPASHVRQLPLSGIGSFALDKLKRAPFSWKRRATRWTDAQLGRKAGQYAAKHGSLLLAYSYYASEAFRYSRTPGMLFQVHPHPVSVRRILSRELEEHPDCAESLQKEWELSLETQDFERLASEPSLAAHCLVASSFTKRTLVENGIDPSSITVIPYGVDSQRFAPGEAANERSLAAPLRLLFVGTIAQRKGIKYLLEALRLLPSQHVELTVCGRAVDDLSLFKPFANQVIVRPSVSASDLLTAYQTSDLFVFPSLVEGFAQVLLESLACGLPILSTTHTAAPDLVREGVEGFVVEPKRPDLLAERIEWALTHRRELRAMRREARRRAELFSHARFQANLVDAVQRFVGNPVAPELAVACV
jgi:glycosyltransferase involved in cell wall biosynthesis